MQHATTSATTTPKTELEKIENLEKGWENSQHSQTLNNVSQGLEFLKESVKNARIVSQVFNC